MKKNGRMRVVVTGMGTVNPLGKNLDEYWDGLIEGRSTARTIEGTFPTEKLSTKFACHTPIGLTKGRFLMLGLRLLR